MKSLIVAACLLTAPMTFAFEGPYPHSTNTAAAGSGRLIKDVEFIAGQADVVVKTCSLQPTHPCDPVTVLTLSFDVAPCKNALGPITIETKRDAKGQLDIYVAATRLNFDTTGRAVCHYHMIEKKEFVLGMGFLSRGDVRVRFMGTPAN